MSEKLIQFLELNDYITDNTDILSKEEKERLIRELNILVFEILNED